MGHRREMGDVTRKKSKLGAILVWLLVAGMILVVMVGVVRLAEWTVRATFHDEESSGLSKTRTTERVRAVSDRALSALPGAEPRFRARS